VTSERRWNGWGDPAVTVELGPHGLATIVDLLGPGTPPRDATLTDVVAGVPPSRLDGEAGLSTDPEDRIRHARGQDLPDAIALRSGRLPAVPDAIARPSDAAGVRGLLTRADATGWTLLPRGGGTSVVGGVTVVPSERPVVVVDLGGLRGLRALDPASGLATVGAGTLGPALETALGEHGRRLGHRPQSWEYSSVGGWVVTRSSGATSMGDGRIEALFAGGHLETPVGPLDLPPFPASAAGPDLRHVVLGSEGRLGILTEVIVRTAPHPVRDVVRAYALPDWERALELARTLADARLPLSMVRVSTPLETATMIALIPSDRSRRLLRRYLGWRGQGGAESCLVLVGMAGSDKVVRAVEGEVGRLIRDRRGIGVPTLGPAWARERYRAPYLRDALWSEGYAVDTVETAVDWSRLPALAAALGPALRHGLEAEGERVHAYSHLSHLYPSGSSLYVTFAFRLAPDPDQTLDRWRRLKALASATIVEHGGTISHQHGVGRVHAPFLEAEKGALGMAALDGLIERFDPRGVLARGVLVEDGGS
jgi:alkyldihydroxyacetonephosphate synthase